MKPAIVLFDGVCNFCEASVQFVIKRDAKEQFKFASLQSDFAAQLFTRHKLNIADYDSIVLVQDDKLYFKSTAALKIAKQLAGIWPLLNVFIIVPAVIRDTVYDFVARHRYQWFGKKDQCLIPDTNIRNRFIESIT